MTGARRFPPPALRVRTFRWYWLTQWPVLIGTWMQIVALGYFVLQVTHSTTAVSVVAAADGIPAVVLSVSGGVLADRYPRRRILLVTQSVLGVSAGTLGVLAVTGVAGFWSILAVAVVFGAADAMDLPTRQALIGDLVERDLVMSAVALGSVAMSASRIVGPSLAGVLIALVGPGACFLWLSVSYLGPLVVLAVVIPDIAPASRERRSAAAESVRAVVGALRDPLVRPLVVSASALSFFGVSYMPFLPVYATSVLHSDARVLGLLYSTGGVGGLVAGLILASLGRGSQRVRMLFAGGIVYAAGLFTLSHSGILGISLPALVAISFGFLAMNTSMMTLIQTETDPALRGRLLGVYALVFAGLQPLGTLLYGVVSHVVPLFDAIGVGGLLVGATAIYAATRPALRALAPRARPVELGDSDEVPVATALAPLETPAGRS
jgi:MFS family permease